VDVIPFDIVVGILGVLCNTPVFCQHWHRSSDSFPAKLKLLHPAAGLHHPGLLYRWIADRSLPFLDGRLLSPQKRGRDRWWLVARSPV
jgi:hypothetical protein